jgi:hypothetical protein
MRLSTDIDIVVEPGTDIDYFIEKARLIFPFKDDYSGQREPVCPVLRATQSGQRATS